MAVGAARLLLATAAAYAAPRDHNSVLPVGLVASTATAACSKCGLGGHGVLNCCSSGGSWEGTCKDNGPHTWEEGQFACDKEVKATEQQQEQARELDGLEAELENANKRAQKAKEDLEQRKATAKPKHSVKSKATAAKPKKATSKPTDDENKWQDLSGLPDDADPRKCVAREGQTIGNGWCVMNCGGTPPNCPGSLCCCAVAPGDCDSEVDAVLNAVKDTPVKAIKSLPKDADEVDAALKAFTSALEHAATGDTENVTNPTKAIKESQRTAPKKTARKEATKSKEPAPSLNESEWQDLSGLGNGTDPTACVAVCGQKTADSHWCVTNCGGTPPNCPATLCTCAADAPNCEEEEAKAAKKAEEDAQAAKKAAKKAAKQAEEVEAAKQAEEETKAAQEAKQAKADAKAAKEAASKEAKHAKKEANATANATSNATANAAGTEEGANDAMQAVRDWEVVQDWEPNQNATLKGATTPAAVDSTLSGAKATPSANESKWQDLTGLSEGADPAACAAVCGQKTADDKWCVMNCGGTPPNCPATLCTCAGNAPNCEEEAKKAAKKAEEDAKLEQKAEKTQAAKEAAEDKAAKKAEIIKAARQAEEAEAAKQEADEAYDKASKRVKRADGKDTKKRSAKSKKQQSDSLSAMACKDNPNLPHCGLNESVWQDLSGLPDGAGATQDPSPHPLCY